MFSRHTAFTSIVIALLLSSCASVTELLPEEKATSVLSGREGVDSRVLAVKIDDSNMAHPQIGVEDAEIVYIQQVEGGLTRLAAIFSTIIPQRIGPVRSARISDINILSQYGRVAFAYVELRANFFQLSPRQIFRIWEHSDKVPRSIQPIHPAINRMQWYFEQIF